jgi:hypothetical protein
VDENDWGFFFLSSFLLTLIMMNLLVAIMMGKFSETMENIDKPAYAQLNDIVLS